MIANCAPGRGHSLALAISLALAAGGSRAATISVTSQADDNGSGCTLREAIVSMNSQALQDGCSDSSGNGFGNDDTIMFGSEVPSGSTVTLSLGELTVSGLTASLTVQGSGQTIDANHDSRVMKVASNVTLTLSSLTLTNGSATYGGGIYSHQADLTLDHATVTNNTGSNYAAGIDATGTSGSGALTLNQSIVSNNTLNAQNYASNAGGVYAGKTRLTVVQTTISDNVLYTNYAFAGGGIYLVNGVGLQSYIVDSTISGNSVSVSGDLGYQIAGGIYSNISPLSITNSTISGNTASCSYECAGALLVSQYSLALINSTISGNRAMGSTNTSQDSGGVLVGPFGGKATLMLYNTILAGNSADGSSSDLYVVAGNGTATASASLLGSALYGSSLGAGNLYDDSPGLSQLGDHGGLTKTMALISASPAIDKGDDSVCAAAPVDDMDQRGVTRSLQGAHCDIGAFEFVDEIFANGFDP